LSIIDSLLQHKNKRLIALYPGQLRWDTTTLQSFYGPFSGPPGWAGARRELDYMVQGKINRGRHTDHPAGRHSIRTN